MDLHNLPPLAEARPGGVDLAAEALPGWLTHFWDYVAHQIDYARAQWPHHKCPKCGGRETNFATNYDYAPTEAERADPVYWVAFPSQDAGTPFIGAPRMCRTEVMPRSRYLLHETTAQDSFVFYKSTFHPCAFSFDWRTLRTLHSFTQRRLTPVDLITADLDLGGVRFTPSSHPGVKFRVHRSTVARWLKANGPDRHDLEAPQIPPDEVLRLWGIVESSNKALEEATADVLPLLRYYHPGCRLNWLAEEEEEEGNGVASASQKTFSYPTLAVGLLDLASVAI